MDHELGIKKQTSIGLMFDFTWETMKNATEAKQHQRKKSL
jgi:hypothetical protein